MEGPSQSTQGATGGGQHCREAPAGEITIFQYPYGLREQLSMFRVQLLQGSAPALSPSAAAVCPAGMSQTLCQHPAFGVDQRFSERLYSCCFQWF